MNNTAVNGGSTNLARLLAPTMPVAEATLEQLKDG